jgi:hypothetical protein
MAFIIQGVTHFRFIFAAIGAGLSGDYVTSIFCVGGAIATA